ncbi:hypothetical protein H1S01_13145 [Heliobacterium chlorum]|uniref:Uncharacterized protein n=1 Tax=Heliobacterium chlorum TaxID=2698 RepID=A0ABR7T5U4_HELCL|nr:hypothetical protein [Heliobacterium chlorum]MBC9785452.1 hypothetical protein [Heliobacterium chlorum]
MKSPDREERVRTYIAQLSSEYGFAWSEEELKDRSQRIISVLENEKERIREELLSEKPTLGDKEDELEAALEEMVQAKEQEGIRFYLEGVLFRQMLESHRKNSPDTTIQKTMEYVFDSRGNVRICEDRVRVGMIRHLLKLKMASTGVFLNVSQIEDSANILANEEQLHIKNIVEKVVTELPSAHFRYSDLLEHIEDQMSFLREKNIDEYLAGVRERRQQEGRTYHSPHPALPQQLQGNVYMFPMQK